MIKLSLFRVGFFFFNFVKCYIKDIGDIIGDI